MHKYHVRGTLENNSYLVPSKTPRLRLGERLSA
ncbi:hypothetical protein Taro_039177 [Colocasia esculenta]|uniref:Uncharacterized protein n=1 Tax=Colocasia esculenta TaxID=4460 RepID=A0A843WEZ8_COLES|nr:hypothetical protein [Colocasia esculenta]